MSVKTTGALKLRVRTLPKKPGIYFFKDINGNTIYIGKARSLKERVGSYFLTTSDSKVNKIISKTKEIDYLLTDTEKEASFLENNFIQQYQPKFNLRCKDDKSFPYLKLTLNEKFPGIYFIRKVKPDRARYFGPFYPSNQARKTILLINKYFGIRSCKEAIPGKRKRPCLEFDLKLCSAPCTGNITASDYREKVNNAILFLEGKTDRLINTLEEKMQQVSDRQKFEHAAYLRDLILMIHHMKDKPKFISVKMENKDIFGFYREKDNIYLNVFLMREGKVVESEILFTHRAEGSSDRETLFTQILRFYKNRKDLPDKILLPFLPTEKDRLSKELRNLKGKKIEIIIPIKGKNKKLVELANRNAEHLLEKNIEQFSPLMELKNILSLKSLPLHIDGFDISSTGGKESVGSLVVFEYGKPRKNKYRKYKIKTVKTPDDVACIREVIQRRYTRLLSTEKRELPDLILVDGGKGQLNTAIKTLNKLGLENTPVISLAKKEEIIFTPHFITGIRLDRTSPALKLIQRVRDEAHRFAISFHRQQRKKKSFSSFLDNIPGIGKKRKALLLDKYKGITEIKKAPLGELAKLTGPKTASILLETINMGVNSNAD